MLNLKKILLIIAVSLLFSTNVALPADNLRVPLNTREIIKRQQEIQLELKGGFYKRVFEGQKQTEKVIYEKFNSAGEREEAQKLIESLVITLVNKGIDPVRVLGYSIPVLIGMAGNTDDLRETLLIIENLAIALAEKKASIDALRYAISAITAAAKDVDELKNIYNNVLPEFYSGDLTVISNKNIRDALGFLKQGGGFRVEYVPGYAGLDDNYEGIQGYFIISASGGIKSTTLRIYDYRSSI